MTRWPWSSVALVLVGVVVARRLQRVEVVGHSMRPTLEPGDRLVLWRGPDRPLRPGDLVAVVDPRSMRSGHAGRPLRSGHAGRQEQRTVVKRLAAVTGDGLTVVGDNPAASSDSRTFGPVAPQAFRGRVLYRYHPPDRRGDLPLRP